MLYPSEHMYLQTHLCMKMSISKGNLKITVKLVLYMQLSVSEGLEMHIEKVQHSPLQEDALRGGA